MCHAYRNETIFNSERELVMRFSKLLGVLALTIGTFCWQTAFGTTVNGDIEGGAVNQTYVGDDGVLSSAGGTVWNSIPHFVNTAGLLDEFGVTTGINVTWVGDEFGPAFDIDSTNALQDSGSFGDGFEIAGLQASSVYNLVIYATDGSSGTVTHATASIGGFWNSGFGGPTYSLPGGEGQDYALFSGLVPFDLGGGVLGIRIDGLDGAITGFQLSAPVPLPAAVWLFGSAMALIGWKRRRKTA
ncbi:MAG: hypothetical protein ACI8XZ_003315 [Gammaproteobacteria bacterium]|jgi:hypothetical protein